MIDRFCDSKEVHERENLDLILIQNLRANRKPGGLQLTLLPSAPQLS